MDIVYTLASVSSGKGSKWKNNELRYALRSVYKYLSGYGSIYIVSDALPDFIKKDSGIHLIPFPDNSAYNKEKNIFEKISEACKDPRISKKFLFKNDDHFLLQPMTANSIPYYHKGCLEPAFKMRPPGDIYRTELKNTFLALSKKKLTTNHFDVHTPIIYDKEIFLHLVGGYDWTVPYGYVIKSLYCNSARIKGEEYRDCKINKPFTKEMIAERIKYRKIFSIGDEGLTSEMKSYLNQLYPEPSPWENDVQ